jgi:protein SCO1/2
MSSSGLRFLLIAATVAGLLAVGANVWLWHRWQPPPGQATPTAASRIGGPFDLVDQNSDRRGATGFRGHYMLVRVGYTNCPDVCSVALDTVSRAGGFQGTYARGRTLGGLCRPCE